MNSFCLTHRVHLSFISFVCCQSPNITVKYPNTAEIGGWVVPAARGTYWTEPFHRLCSVGGISQQLLFHAFFVGLFFLACILVMQSTAFQTIYQFRSGDQNSTELHTENILLVQFMRHKVSKLPLPPRGPSITSIDKHLIIPLLQSQM